MHILDHSKVGFVGIKFRLLEGYCCIESRKHCSQGHQDEEPRPPRAGTKLGRVRTLSLEQEAEQALSRGREISWRW